MKTAINIPAEQLEEANRHPGASTQREAVVTAIVELNRRRRLAKLVERFETCEHFLTHGDLKAQRSDS